MNPFPNLAVLGIIDGERGGIPVLPPAGVDWKGAPTTPGGQVPDPATNRGQRTIDDWLKAGGKVPPQQKPAPDCLLPTPWGCLLSRETGTLFGVNALLVIALVIGGLMLLVPVAAKGVTIVAGSSPVALGRKAIKGAMRGKEEEGG